MLSYTTIEPHTLELLKKLMLVPALRDMRLVGGTALVPFLMGKHAEGMSLHGGYRIPGSMDVAHHYFALIYLCQAKRAICLLF